MDCSSSNPGLKNLVSVVRFHPGPPGTVSNRTPTHAGWRFCFRIQKSSCPVHFRLRLESLPSSSDRRHSEYLVGDRTDAFEFSFASPSARLDARLEPCVGGSIPPRATRIQRKRPLRVALSFPRAPGSVCRNSSGQPGFAPVRYYRPGTAHFNREERAARSSIIRKAARGGLDT